MKSVLGRGDLLRLLQDGSGDNANRASLLGYEYRLPKQNGAETQSDTNKPQERDARFITRKVDVAPLFQPTSFRDRGADQDKISASDGSSTHTSRSNEADITWRAKPTIAPDYLPLGPEHRIAMLVERQLGSDAAVGAPDINRAVVDVASGKIVRTIPRKRRRAAIEEIDLFVDRSPGMEPFQEDFRRIAIALRRYLPEARFQVHLIDGTGGVHSSGRDGSYAHENHAPQAPCIALTDLKETRLQNWSGFGKKLGRAGLPAIAISPYRSYIDPELNALWSIQYLDHRPLPEDPIAAVRTILTLCAHAIRLEPQLVRAIRESFAPQSGPQIEAMIWQSPAIASAHPSAATLDPKEATHFRKEFQTLEEDHQRRALKILRSYRAATADAVWFQEIAGLGEDVGLLEDERDAEDAKGYFGQLNSRIAEGINTQSPHLLAWVSRVGDWFEKDTNAWCDPNLLELMSTIKDERFAPDVDPIKLKSKTPGITDISIDLVGDTLCLNAIPTSGHGSILGQLPSDNGLIEIEPLDPFWEVWGPSGEPDWATASGTDDYGIWAEFMVKAVSHRLRWCPPGRFTMGSPENEDGRHGDEGPQTAVTFKLGFWMLEGAVSQALWTAVMEGEPSHFKGADLPVEQVSWDDCLAFCDRINAMVPGLDLRLPSEAEWEYACRAGSHTPFEPNVAAVDEGKSATTGEVNFADSSFKGVSRTVAIKGEPYQANAWGLWHMHGNVWEWCADPWHESHEGADPKGLARSVSKQAPNRVLRGGAWNVTARDCRAAFRFNVAPDFRNDYLGFRPARGRELRQVLSPEGTGSAAGKAEKAEPIAAQRQDSRAKRGNISREKILRARVARGQPGLVKLPSAPFVIRTDRAELKVFQQHLNGAEMGWADAMGRDRFGLWSEITHGSVTQRLRWCPPGRFTMGSPEDEPGRYEKEGPETVVTLSAGFWLFSTPVTQALYEAVTGENPSRFVSADRPVEDVSWDDATKFIDDLNRLHAGLELRLPSEAEWEYACRAGTETATWAGPIEILGENNAPVLDEIAWYGGNSGVGWDLPEAEGYDASSRKDKQHSFEKMGTRRVGQKRANPWGLHDMLGNVWEWCADTWYESHEGADPTGLARSVSQQTSETPKRVMRGGAWDNSARNCRAAYRYDFAPDFRDILLGFRPARGHEHRQVLTPEGSVPAAGKAKEAEPNAAQRQDSRAKRGIFSKAGDLLKRSPKKKGS